MTTITVETSLVTVNCGECGGVYAIEKRYHERKREQGGFWTCPYCKTDWGFRREGTENEQLRREKARLEAAVTAERARHDQTKAELAAQKGITTKLRKKIGRTEKGVCPHCNRYFSNLHAHMTTQHAEEVRK